MKPIDKVLEAVKLYGPDRKAYSYLGMINVQIEGNLLIFNYSKECGHKSEWNDVELICRGLIINYNEGEPYVQGRAFDKFFNLEQAEETKILNLPPEDEIDSVTFKEDGCFREDTPLNLWGGGTITIGEIVNKNLNPILVGVDEDGNVVPCDVTNKFKNGKKNNWLEITLSNKTSEKTGAAKLPNKLRVTSNHNVFVNGVWQPIGNAKIGDWLMSYEKSPSDKVLHLIHSGLLGDGSLVKTHNSFRYQESHNKKSDYNNFIESWLGNTKIKSKEIISGYGSEMKQVSTKAYRILESVRNKWYDSHGKKHLPENLDWFDNFTIAKWYMDDGSLPHSELQNDRALFATHGFSKTDVEKLANKLYEMYGVNAIVSEDGRGKGFYIRVNYSNGSINNMWKSIAPYIIFSLRYKLPDEYKNVDFMNYKLGEEVIISKVSEILNVKSLEVNKKNFPSGAVGYDIETTTHSYFAKGILVHNSMGFTYIVGDKTKVATRGSFNSEQAVWATYELNNNPDISLNEVPDNVSLIFEIIYPENRVVLDYRGEKKLVLIGVRNLDDGYEWRYKDLVWLADRAGFELAHNAYTTSISKLLEDAKQLHGIEGWVIRYKNGLRVKIKTEEYIALHRLVSHLTPKHVKELLMQPEGRQLFNDFQINLPDEFGEEAKRYAETLLNQHSTIAQYCLDIYDTLLQQLDSLVLSGAEERVVRKEMARTVNELFPYYRDILFALYDEKPIDKLIWKRISVKEIFGESVEEKELAD